MTALVVIFGGISSILLATCIIGYIWIRRLVQQNLELIDANEEYDTWLLSVTTTIQSTYDEMLALDESGAFQADDEIGHTFETLRELIEKLKTIV